uniref:sn-1-specific diacylglycerol lipase n=1 Tax=Mucochytrium quahogii TaxID=96639 RepID=A0A7S2SED5_9STRA|mmetsp:Transcript_19911/g.32766  ORF Transcript_19911/g.32766 Transcript_19911/m.32766 type:complete len:592 (-) Transcript_19911:328-2103(-)
MLWYFLTGCAVGLLGTVSVLIVLTVILVPFHEETGQVTRSGFVRGKVGDKKGRLARWEARKKNVGNVVSSVSRPLTSGLKFALYCCELGFSIGINVTVIDFWIARKCFHIADILIDRLCHRFPVFRRLGRFLHFVDEVVGYAELITLFSLRLSRLLVHVMLESTLKVLHLHRFMSPLELIGASLNVASSICFRTDTLDAICALTDMIARETGVFSDTLRLGEFVHSIRALEKYQKGTSRHLASDVIYGSEESKIFADIDCCEDIAAYVMFAIAPYGQKALKFLSIIPYGSVTSDVQGAAYVTGLESTKSVILSEWEGGLFHPGYVLVVDETRKTIVLSVRGSIMPQDFLTDLICTSCKVKLIDNIEGYAHKGMFESATNLDRKLRAVCCNILLQREYSKFQFVITGHSLGAGVATLLGTLWLSPESQLLPEGQSGRIRVFGYGTPAVLSPNFTKRLSRFVTTVVVGNDMVPRFSLGSFQRLRERTLDLWKRPGTAETLSRENDQHEELEKIWKAGSQDHHAPTLVSPGRVLLFDDTHGSDIPRENLRVLDCTNSVEEQFQDMVLCENMFSSHLPQHYCSLLGDVPCPEQFI